MLYKEDKNVCVKNLAIVRADALTSADLCTKLRVIRSMCVYSVSSRRFLCSFSLFLVTSPNSTSSLWSCSCKHTDEYCKERLLELNERTCK